MFPLRDVLHTLMGCSVGRVRPTLLFALVTLAVVLGPSIASAQQLNLSWDDNSGGQAGFIIQRAPGSTGTYTQIAQLPPGGTSYTDTSASLGTTYCYEVAAVNASGVSAFSNLACASPSGGFTLTTAKAGTGVGTVTSSPTGIDCGAICSYTYLAGKAVTLTATPSSGSNFSSWSGGGCSGTDPCTLVGNGSITTTATFATVEAAPTVKSVTPNQGAPGAAVPVTINGSGFAAGATVSISGTGVTPSNVTVGSATQLAATLTIASGAALGTRNVTVANASGVSGTLTGGFTVIAPLSLSPPGTFTDDFARPDASALGNGWTSTNWSIKADPQTGQQRAMSVAAKKPAMSVALAPLSGVTQTVSADFIPVDLTGERFCLLLRWTATGGYMACRATGGTSVLRLIRVVNGVESVLRSVAISNPAKGVPFTLTTTISGNTFSMGVGATKVSPVNTATDLTPGSVGMRIDAGAGATSHAADNFTATVQ